MSDNQGMPMDEGAGAVFADGGDVAAPQEASSTNVVSPEGDLVSVSNDQLDAALHPVNGYRLATPDDITNYQNEQKYGGATGALKAAGIEAAKTATFGAATPFLGTPEAQAGYEQQHPIASVLGGLAPFAAEALVPGVGEAGIAAQAGRAATTVPRAIGEAGEAIKAASGLTGTSAKALQYAAEGAIMQGSNEVSKALLNDPESTASNVLANEGMAALFSGALGAAAGGIGKAADIWTAKYGAKATDAVIDKTIPNIAEQELKAGIEVPASMRTALSGDQDAYNSFQTIQKSDGYAAKQVQKDVDNLYQQAQDRTLETLGTDPNMVGRAPNNYEVGTQLADKLKEGIKSGQELYGPIYDNLKSQYKNIPVSADQKAAFAGKLTQALSDAGVGALEGSAEKSTMNNLFKSLDTINNAEGIKNLSTGLNNSARNPELQRLAAVAGPVIKDFESSAVQSHLGASDPSGVLLGQRKVADAAYKNAMNTMNDLKQALGLGRFKGTNGFLRALDDKPPEQILQRLSAKNRQDMVNMLQEKFPGAAEILKDYHLNRQLNDAALPGGGLNTKKFLNNMLDGAENPQHIQDLMTGKDPLIAQRLESIKNILNAVPKDGNPSNSASMLNKLWMGKLGSVVGGVLGLGGHGHIAGGFLGGAADKVLSEIKPFLSYKMLEMRGAGKNIVPEQVKALFDYAKSASQGHMLVNKAINGVFNQSQVVPNSKVPSDADRNKLDKYLDAVRKNPESLMNTAKDIQDNMSEHASALSMTATQAANYLNAIKPRPPLGGPLDTKIPPSQAAMTEYHRQLNIAQQPLMALKHVQDGSLTPKDLATLQACHPGAYNQYKAKIMDQLATPGIQIPYKTRLSMSLFVGQALDSTMTPQAIMGAQPLPPQQQPQGGVPGNKPKRSTSSLNKLPGQYKTAGQAAEANRANKD